MSSPKFFSLIIIPHRAKRFRRITLSQKWIRIMAAGSVLCFVSLLGFLVDYFSMGVTRAKYRGLLRENVEQKRLLSDYESSVKKLRETVTTYENYAKKLNVMAGFRSPDIAEELGVGDGEAPPPAEVPADPQVSPPGRAAVIQEVKNLAERAEAVGKNLDVLSHHFELQATRLASTPTIWPVKGWVSSGFSYRNDPFTGMRVFHYGIDIATNYGNPIVAPADGTVVSLGNDKILGSHIVLSHGNGITTHYLHLSKFLVRNGQKVKRGEIIGLVGKSGKAVGPHLHYEIRLNDRPVNPYNYILEE